MRFRSIFVICLVLAERSTQEDDAYLDFPEDFKIGAGGSSYQIEGAWNISGKGENVWDRLTHTEPWKIIDREDGDVACDSYHKYREDVQWVKSIGLDQYRFSISWARVLPNGSADSINQEGLRYYHNLVDELLANGIEPIVTIYHWDHPQVIEDMGGWLNESMITWFTDYANVIFRELGPKVKVFTTINEPQLFCVRGYYSGIEAPGRTQNIRAAYECGHIVLKAHAEAYHLYDRVYRPSQNGKIGIVSHCDGFLPMEPNDTVAADLAFQFTCGWISHPVFVGDYPEAMKTRIAQLSKDEHLLESRLPKFSPEWIARIRGTSDYFGLNHYTSRLTKLQPDFRGSGLFRDIGVNMFVEPGWEATSLHWLKIAPEGFGELLRKIKTEYNNPPVYVTENGAPDNGFDEDHQRIKYHYLYLKELLLAVHRDGCNVQRYSLWSLMDNFEWESGYSAAFGLLRVNFSSPTRERVPKLSVSWLKGVLRTRRLQPPINITSEGDSKRVEQIVPLGNNSVRISFKSLSDP